MAYFLPDPRSEYPGLLVPGRKPTTKVVVDWSHPFLQRNILHHCFVMNEYGGDALVNLASPVDAVIEGGAEWRPPGLWFPGGGTYSSAKINDGAWGSQSFTIIVKASYDGTYNYPAVFGKGDTGSGEFMLRRNGNLELYTYGAGVAASTSLDVGEEFTAAVFHDVDGAANSDRLKLYKNGVDVAGAGGPALNVTSKPCEIGNADSASASTRRWAGAVHHCYVFFNPMTPEDIISITNDPYQFLVPA